MHSFSYDALPGRVIFGPGYLAQLVQEIDHLKCHKALIIVTPSAQEKLSAIQVTLGERCAGLFSQVVEHVPLPSVIAARAAASEVGADCVVTLGGGSAIGLGKAVALETGLALIAVPTTFSGSEMTPIYGITSEGRKRTGRDSKVLPRTVIYDPELTYGMLPSLAASSGLNALAHCVEALYGKLSNPVTSLMAEEGARVLGKSLPLLGSTDPSRRQEAYNEAFYGAYLAGAALAVVGTALHHRTCHVLGGTFNLPHSGVNAVILPYAVWYNREAVPVVMQRLAQALNVPEAVTGLFELVSALKVPSSLAQLGMAESDLDKAAFQVLDPPAWNPAPVEFDRVRRMLQAAYEGRRLA